MIDKDLLVRCIKKEAKAQRLLYDVLNKKLMGISIRYSRDRDEAKDIFQEAFIKIFNNLEKVKDAHYLERWAKTTTIHTAINHYKRNKKHYDNLPTEEVSEIADFTLKEAISTISQKELLALIGTLPEGFKIVFNLYVIEGYNHREIAEMLGISEGTSKSQLSRAKASLKEMLKKIGISQYKCYG